jgi:radical SAM protein with 4Fe4S-binding SPASM domain
MINQIFKNGSFDIEQLICQIDDSTTTNEEWKHYLENTDLKHPAFQIDDNSVLGIPRQNRLRKDSKQVIYYGLSLFDSWTYRLLPSQVIFLSLFDGQKTLSDVIKEVAFLSNCNELAAELKIRFFLKNLGFYDTQSFVIISENGDRFSTQKILVKDYLIPDTERTYRLDAPVTLMLMLTDKCLTDCEYCYACRQPITKQLLSVKRIFELIDEANKLGVITINLNGGDLFARPEHLEILEYIINYDIEPGISTKGYISKEKAQKLAKIGLKWLQVGLDSTREMCDKLVRRSGYFDRMVETIHNLTDAGIRVRTNSIITRESLHLLPELVDFLMTLPLFDIKVAPAFLGLYRSNESMLLTQLQKKWYRSVMEEKVKQYSDHKINWECEEDILDASREQVDGWFKSRPYCSSGRTQIVITPDGKVTTCEQSPQSGEFICGDCTYQSIEEIWNSETLKKWYEPTRENFEGTACYDCQDFVYCIHGMGHCWLQVFKIHKRLHAPHPYCPKSESSSQRWR